MPSRERPLAASVVVPVTEPSQVGEVRRTVAAVCRSLELGETEGGQASIVASELAMNVLRHGGGGEVLVRSLREGDAAGVELVGIDRGPGIADMDAALVDGHSTVGTPGTGFGAMRRLSPVFDVYSQRGQGTIVLAQVWGADRPGPRLDYGVVSVPKVREDECGDVWDVEPRPGGLRVLIADGLGHGTLARDAALTAVRATYARPAGAAGAVEDAHRASRPTRGAAIAVADVDLGSGEIRYAGLGNVAGVLVAHETIQNMVSMNGTAGQGVVKLREFSYRFAPGTLLVMFSDGLVSHWSMERYPGLLRRHPGLVAAALYRDHSRRRDDVTVVAVRLGTLG